MNESLLESVLAGTLLGLFGLMATFAAGVLWAAAGAGSPGAGLSAVLYAPFALLALVMPALSAPLARRALIRMRQSRPAGGAPAVLRFAALLGAAEALTVAARLGGGDTPLATPFTHGLLAAHSAVAAFLPGRTHHEIQNPRATA